MNATEIIGYLREQNFTVKADGEYLELSPPEKITDELIQRLKKYKPEILAELRRESRREKVLTMLTENPDSQRAIITDLNNDSDNIILTIAIRDQYTFEMQVPKHLYGGFLMLELIERGSLQ